MVWRTFEVGDFLNSYRVMRGSTEGAFGPVDNRVDLSKPGEAQNNVVLSNVSHQEVSVASVLVDSEVESCKVGD